ncbi:MAG: flagellar protein [Acetatifactor sp.]|nr:flagellar protein [Acetatifactor sp.]
MNVRSCKICKRLFNYLSGPTYCPACRDRMEEKFQEVKTFIRENPGVHIQEVADSCEVETAQIRQWLREERLELTEGSPLMLSCDSCGAPIRCGRYCEKCKANVSNGFKDILNTNTRQNQDTFRKKEDGGSKMRFL